MVPAANLGPKHVQNAIPEHFQLVEMVGNGYFERSFFHLTYLIQVTWKKAILIGKFLVNCDERFG